jgi:hypothetical protein
MCIAPSSPLFLTANILRSDEVVVYQRDIDVSVEDIATDGLNKAKSAVHVETAPSKEDAGSGREKA